MTYDRAFDAARRVNETTGVRMRIYKFVWDGSYETTPYLLPLVPYSYAILVGEVGRRTPR